ncbi:Hsp20/alpha crystallin family protein [Halobacillus sp. BBL2006]|uniref:Hsp20/alpha crystallin family protein n=1 Tax=Halobacillus sp. BBL2006 TaxID=1543706 RepID=UPI0005424A5B|nr:Hsp20/alpha crystallin family protein [Halobacillus sp. BBL2006]KHE67012.1 hypothetical protein LD39_19745 [Halobacillus sp. BBL2006]
MDMDRLKEWLKIANQYQSGDFWNHVFDQESNHPFAEDQVKEEVKSDLFDVKDYPKTDIFMTETHVVVFIELPGVEKENIHLSSSGTKLYVTVHVLPSITDAITVQAERVYGEHQRAIDLPHSVEGKYIHTSFSNGLMVLSYEKSREELKDIIIE